MEGGIEQLRRDPSSFASLGLKDVVDHYEQIIRELETPPIIIGYGFGGLVTQILLDRGWGAAGAAIASAPVKGIARLPLSMLKLAFSVLGNSFNSQRDYFANSETISSRVYKLADRNRIARRLQTLRRAGSVSGSGANSVRKFHFTHCSHRQLSERHARAITPGCGRQRSRRAQFTSKSKLRAVSRIESRN